MKKLIALILSALLVVSLAACGVGGPRETQPPEVYVPLTDVEVAVAFVENETATVITRASSDAEMKELELTCVFYGENGAQVGEVETIECEIVTTNGRFHIWTFRPTLAYISKYVDAIVSGVTYADGTTKNCSGAATWAAGAAKAFTLDNYNKRMDEVAKKEAVAAEKCDAVEFSMKLAEENKVKITAKNIGNKDISEVVLYVLWFDADGAPVDIKGVPYKNVEKISVEDLAVDEEATYNATAVKNAAAYKAIVKSVTFKDETVWENDYFYEWGLVNRESAE